MLLFFIAIFLQGLAWVYLIPMWHTPDEQAHFGQVAYMALEGRRPKGDEMYDLTEEIYTSEKVLGTARDEFGNNRFTFHPEYRIDYTDTFSGKYEKEIESLSKTDAKSKFIHKESTRYPALYYLPAAWLYKFFINQNLFVRVFMVRFWSVILFVASIYIVYRLACLLFPNNRLLALVLPVLVGFQPMMVFSSVGVNSDSLGNFLFTFFIYLSARVMYSANYKKDFPLLIFVSALAVYTKPQFVIVLPLLLILSVYILFQLYLNNKVKKQVIFVSILFGIFTFLILVNLLQWPVLLIRQFFGNLEFSSLWRYSWEYTLPHTIREVLPWYWGVYDWLGVTYPRQVHRIINRIIIFAFLGVLIGIFRVLKGKKWKNKNIHIILFLNLTSILFFVSISLYDWLIWYTGKYSLGVQGRYFFPVISVNMLMLMIGLRSIIPKWFDLKTIMIKLLAILMLILNFYAFYLVASTYYDIFPLDKFVIQASQYKPWFIKGGSFVFCIVIYILFVFVGILRPLIKSADESDNI